jgi:hypothetical protein
MELNVKLSVDLNMKLPVDLNMKLPVDLNMKLPVDLNVKLPVRKDDTKTTQNQNHPFSTALLPKKSRELQTIPTIFNQLQQTSCNQPKLHHKLQHHQHNSTLP